MINSDLDREKQLTLVGEALREQVRGMKGNLLILGAGGKMGPTLASLAANAVKESNSALKVIAVSRFSDKTQKDWLERRNIQTIAADLLKENEIKNLPDADWVISLAGKKFGTSSEPSETWAVNCLVSAEVCKRYKASKIVALSTGNVYPSVPIDSLGSKEEDLLVATGEYSAAAIGRERVLQYYAKHCGVKVAIVRLNYAVDMVYGVLVDIAQKIMAHQTIDLTMGYFNCIWQRDANEAVLRLLPYADSPEVIFNLSGPCFGVRQVAIEMGKYLGENPKFLGNEGETALLTNSSKLNQLLGPPVTPLAQVIEWTAGWIKQRSRTLGKPTKFEVVDGKY